MVEWFQRRNSLSGEREKPHKVIETFQECGAHGWVKRTEEKFAQL
jgi:hypothetical protein